ncbi:unnamed protein product [Phytophthora fragariaefolia]|uniref:Unnamed protein product n=1 Tax=Phytophthora fragariaefolia TaxID=1490495 RepID=A0A9W6WZN2_9STRA|nr:unnamed protein product [Phytophthora fragariaefolia]
MDNAKILAYPDLEAVAGLGAITPSRQRSHYGWDASVPVSLYEVRASVLAIFNQSTPSVVPSLRHSESISPFENPRLLSPGGCELAVLKKLPVALRQGSPRKFDCSDVFEYCWCTLPRAVGDYSSRSSFTPLSVFGGGGHRTPSPFPERPASGRSAAPTHRG